MATTLARACVANSCGPSLTSPWVGRYADYVCFANSSPFPAPTVYAGTTQHTSLIPAQQTTFRFILYKHIVLSNLLTKVRKEVRKLMLILVFVEENVNDESNTCVGGSKRGFGLPYWVVIGLSLLLFFVK